MNTNNAPNGESSDLVPGSRSDGVSERQRGGNGDGGGDTDRVNGTPKIAGVNPLRQLYTGVFSELSKAISNGWKAVKNSFTVSLTRVRDQTQRFGRAFLATGVSLFRSVCVLEVLDNTPPDHVDHSAWWSTYPVVLSMAVHSIGIVALGLLSFWSITPPYFQGFAAILSSFSAESSLVTTYHVLTGRQVPYRWGYYGSGSSVALVLNTCLAIALLIGSTWSGIFYGSL